MYSYPHCLVTIKTRQRRHNLETEIQMFVTGRSHEIGGNLEQERVKCTTAYKATVRLLISIAAGHTWTLEHMDITIAYVHEPSSSSKPIFDREFPGWKWNF